MFSSEFSGQNGLPTASRKHVILLVFVLFWDGCRDVSWPRLRIRRSNLRRIRISRRLRRKRVDRKTTSDRM